MKKILISTAIILVLLLTGLIIINGLNLGQLSILGLKQIRKENDMLEQKLKETTALVNITYPQKLQEIEYNLKEMKKEKEKYEDMLATTNQSEVQTTIHENVYTIDKLWEKLGMLARYEGLTATFEPSQGTKKTSNLGVGQTNYNYYDINFTLQGGYANIALYISDIENNSQLGFKIENFKMVPEGEEVKATFICKDIAIKGVSSSPIQNKEDEKEKNSKKNNTKEEQLQENKSTSDKETEATDKIIQ